LLVNDSAAFLDAVWLIDVQANSWSAVETYGKVPVRILSSVLKAKLICDHAY
jgi:hypothetical protein